MTTPSRYPFSDLTHVELHQLVRAARVEQARAVRTFFGRLFRLRQQRETEVWPPESTPALALNPHR